MFFLSVVEVAQHILIFGDACPEFQGGFVITREFLKVFDCMFVRDESHDSDSFPELFP